MSCHGFENLIALDAEEDLAPPEATRLREHLEACAGCRALAQSVRESQAALKTLADGALDEAAVERWRRGVLARIDSEPRRRALGWRWAWVPAMALLALVAVLQLLPRRTPQTPPTPAPLALMTPSPAPPVIAHARRRPHGRPTPKPAGGDLTVRLETPDPNVVIYWIVERRGN
jgi:anti-sigma factor RsiW